MPKFDKNAANLIEREAEAVIALGERFRNSPELGFREFRTGDILEEELRRAGAEVERGLAVTGLRASLGPKDGPEILLVADMDALPTTGAPGGVAHSCGHSAQMAACVAAFRALAESGLPEREGVRLVFVGAPAEEYVEMDYRLGLRAEGKIGLFSGKQELIRLGLFDRAQAVLKYHSMSDSEGRQLTVNGTLNGFLAKRATFLGAAAHAGAQPERGVNALNAAAIAQLAIHAQRETFRDEDHIRVHPILREGGTVVNTVPDRALMETYVRGASFDAILDASAKVDRALAAGAIAVGAKVRVENLPGYQPFSPSPELGAILGEAARARVPEGLIDFHDQSFASDDIGDVASVAPTCQLGCSGFSGTIHSAAFAPSDPRRAYVLPALILAQAAEALAADRGAAAKAARAAFRPRFTREAYVAAVEALFSDRTFFWEPSRAV
jgi:amidohydrolase